MAGLIPEDFINQVSNAVNIVDVISQYVSLEKKGKDYIGLCPFHQEKTPSFTVNEGKQFFKCFGCGKGGNVFKFLMYQENLTFPESVKKVAEMASINLPNGVGTKSAPLSPLMKMYKDATDFYHHILLTTKAGERGLQYSQKRELDEDTVRHFKIGYAPDNDSILLTFLKQRGYDEALLKKSGLFVETQDGRLFDRFRDRLMFPLSDEGGRTIAFSGRRISDDPEIAKYVNSPETEIFTKSKLLYHLREAKKAARSEGHLVLYEGYMDVIAAYKAGVESGVASMGTSLTSEQVYILRRINPNVIINYDGDEPGLHAAERAINLFNKVPGFNLGIVALPEKLDPDEYIKKYGKAEYQNAVNNALAPTEFLLDRLAFSKYNLDNDRDKLAYINDAVGIIAKLSDPVATDIALEKLAKQTEVSTESLKASLLRERRKLRKRAQYQAQYAQNAPTTEPPKVAETALNPQESLKMRILKRLLYLFMHYTFAENYLKGFLFPDENYAMLVEKWLNYKASHQEAIMEDRDAAIKGFYNSADIDDNLQSIITDLQMTETPTDLADNSLSEVDFENKLKQEIDDQLRVLENNKIDDQLKHVQLELDDARQKNDGAKILELIQEIIKLQKQKS